MHLSVQRATRKVDEVVWKGCGPARTRYFDTRQCLKFRPKPRTRLTLSGRPHSILETQILRCRIMLFAPTKGAQRVSTDNRQRGPVSDAIIIAVARLVDDAQ